jgi:hypothetical protein
MSEHLRETHDLDALEVFENTICAMHHALRSCRMKSWPVVVAIDAKRSLPALGRSGAVLHLPHGTEHVVHAGNFACLARSENNLFEVFAFPSPTVEGVL